MFENVPCAIARSEGGANVPLRLVKLSKTGQAFHRHQRVIGPQRLLFNSNSALQRQLALREPTLRLVEVPQVVEAIGNIRMLRAERLLANGQRSLFQCLCLGEASLQAVYHADVGENQSNPGMVWP